MKHRVNVTVDKDNYQVVSVSGLVKADIGNETRRMQTEEWKQEHREGMEEVVRFIAQNGSFADENRNW